MMPGWATIGRWALKGLPVIIFVVLLATALQIGFNKGKAKVYAEWNQSKLETAQHIGELKQKIEQNATRLRDANQKNSDQLSEVELAHSRTVADLRTQYAERMRRSSDRASIYQRMSEAGSTQRANLASYAAQLDRSLEQGRQLVGELRSTVEQRDEQLRLVGQRLLNDRALMEPDKAGDTTSSN